MVASKKSLLGAGVDVKKPTGSGVGYNLLMDYSDYLIYKFVALVVIVFLVNFFYAAATGRTIEQVRRDKESEQSGSSDHEAH